MTKVELIEKFKTSMGTIVRVRIPSDKRNADLITDGKTNFKIISTLTEKNHEIDVFNYLVEEL